MRHFFFGFIYFYLVFGQDFSRTATCRHFSLNGLGIGPRDISPGIGNNKTASLGGITYFGGTLELQFPIYGLPREVGLRGALFADAGTLFGYKSGTNFSTLVGLPAGTQCINRYQAPTWSQNN